ncbi:MAG: histidinol phosphate phosphatase domain-containing protein [Planctomycetota bacterium]
MIDFHTHTLFSDGELIPAELVRRCEAKGYRAVVIADHVDHSTLDFVIPRVARVSKALAKRTGVVVVPGAELTHVPPQDVKRLVAEARRLGARVVLVHGETIVEPVAPGTNRAAIEAGADVLAHPGLLTPRDAKEAAKRGVLLEISGRKGHSLTNGHVARLAREAGAGMVFGSDAHEPGDLLTREQAMAILAGTGLDGESAAEVFRNAERKLRLPEAVLA